MTGSIKSFPLPYPLPDGAAWAAIRGDAVVNMIYMKLPAGMTFDAHREASRAILAKDGVVWTGDVRKGSFIPRFDSRDVRRGGELNTARAVNR